jgi:hypothetical protein
MYVFSGVRVIRSLVLYVCFEVKFEDTKGDTKSHRSMNAKQHNDHKKAKKEKQCSLTG